MLRRLLLLTLLGIAFLPVAAAFNRTKSRDIMQLGRGIAWNIAWHPSGNLAIVRASDGLWLINHDFTQVQRITYNDMRYGYPEWSPDGNWLAIGGNNDSQLWRFHPADNSLTLERTVKHPRDYEYYYVKPRWHPNSRYVLFDRWLDVETGTQFDTHTAHFMTLMDTDHNGQYETGIYETFATSDAWWSKDGRKFVGRSIAYASDGGGYAIFDGITRQKLVDLEGNIYVMSQFTWSSDGTRVTNGSAWWDTRTGQSLEDRRAGYGGGNPYLWDEPSGRMVNLAPPMGNVETYIGIADTTTRTPVHDYAFRNNIVDIDWYGNSRKQITGLTESGDILVIDIATGRVEQLHHLFQAQIYQTPGYGGDLAWSPDSKWLARNVIGSYEPPVEIWQIAGGAAQQHEPYAFINDRRYIDGYEPDDVKYWSGGRLAWTDAGLVLNTVYYAMLRDWQRVVVRDPMTGELRRTLYTQQDTRNFAIDSLPFVIYSPDLTTHIEFFWETPGAILYDTETGQSLWRTEQNVQDAAFSPDSQLLLTVEDNADEKIPAHTKIWDVTSHQPIATLDIARYLDGIAWSPDSTRIATLDGIYDAYTGARLTALDTIDRTQIDCSVPEFVVWSPGGRTIARISSSGIVITNVQTGANLEIITASSVQKMAWSPDGRLLAYMACDGRIHILSVSDLNG